MLTCVFVIAAMLLLRSTFTFTGEDARRRRSCEEHLALVQGSALDRAGWLYGTPRHHDEPDDCYRKRIAAARARTFAV